VFDSPTGRHIATVPFTAGRIEDVAMDRRGTTLATADSDRYTAQLWNLTDLIRSRQR
jgi:hypothetical protein